MSIGLNVRGTHVTDRDLAFKQNEIRYLTVPFTRENLNGLFKKKEKILNNNI